MYVGRDRYWLVLSCFSSGVETGGDCACLDPGGDSKLADDLPDDGPDRLYQNLGGGATAEGICPAGFLGVSDDWEIPDPKGTGIEEFRSVRDFIRARVEELLRTMKEDR